MIKFELNEILYVYKIITQQDIKGADAPFISNILNKLSKEATNIEMTIQGDNIGGNINDGGTEANLKCSIFDINDSTALQHFHCSGRISQQELNVDQQGYLVGGISVTQAHQ